jgi:hypothetical protein
MAQTEVEVNEQFGNSEPLPDTPCEVVLRVGLDRQTERCYLNK